MADGKFVFLWEGLLHWPTVKMAEGGAMAEVAMDAEVAIMRRGGRRVTVLTAAVMRRRYPGVAVGEARSCPGG